MKILFTYLKPFKWLVSLVLLLTAITMGFSLLDPIIFGNLVNLASDYTSNKTNFSQSDFFFKRYNSVMWLLLASIGVAMVSRLAKNFQDYFLNVVIQKFGAKVFTDGLQHAMKLPYQDFEDQRSGETLSILEKVRADTELFMTYLVNVLFTALVGVVFIALFAFNIHWSLPLIYFGGISLLILFTNLLSRKVKSIQTNIVSQTNSLAGATTESLRNIELVKSLGLTQQEVNRLNTNTYKILGLEITKVKRIRSISFLQGTFVNTLRQVILFMLLWLIFKDRMNAGELVTMQMFSFFIFGPLQEIGTIILSYREAEASLENFRSLMRRKPEQQPHHPVALAQVDRLEFRGVSFKHQHAQQKAISDISFTVHKDETIAFVGPSGAGKSTLMKLLVGLYRPQEGKILYNDIDENAIHYDDLRKQIGFVTQDTQLFAGTIRENLLFVNPAADEEALKDALTKAACMNIVHRAESGIDSMIGEGGLKLSGGEKQRLSIARALLRQPRLLIFDEATSALDSLTEEEVTQTIRQVSSQQNQITILIAHRLSTIMHADRIYVLEKGEIIEKGTHDSLLNEKGLYYAMWRQQIGERKTILEFNQPEEEIEEQV